MSTFRRLREEEDFVDVTLACSGRRNFTAHKVVLSACSPYFKQLLKVTARMLPNIYRGLGIYDVKGSVHVFFGKLHHRGERGRKGRECKISKQSTQNL